MKDEATQNATLGPDAVTPFMLHESNVRGRLVRLSEVVNTVLSRHEYPVAVSRLLAEALALAAMLGSNLKGGGIFTLQARGEGAVRMLVVDATHGGELRGYAAYDEDAALSDAEDATLSALFGAGYLAVTLDMGQGDPYQGVVALEGANLCDALTHYFTQSQQVDIAVKVAVEHDEADGWRAGGMMIERMPDGVLPLDMRAVEVLQEAGEEEWRAGLSMMQTLKAEELLDDALSSAELLYRLYNMDGVWVHDPSSWHVGCLCSREKVESALRFIARDDMEDMKLDDGSVEVTCQFCNQSEVFDEMQIERLYK